MRILFICDARLHSHDYGTDFLIQGAYSLLGAENVFEWPEKPHLHLAVGQRRDACNIDSDAWLPAKNLAPSTIADMAARGDFGAVILTGAYGTAEPWQDVCARLHPATPVIGLHYDDELLDTRPHLARIMRGRSLAAYYHRENPPPGALPLFLTQPWSRFRAPAAKPLWGHRVFYWGAERPMRRRMIESIERCVAPDHRMLRLTLDQQHGRLSCEAYRERLWESAVSVVWNSDEEFPVWDSNRLWESLALGCAVVAERPNYSVPDIRGITWIDTPEDAGPAVTKLLALPVQKLHELQDVSERDARKHYSSEVIVGLMLAGL